MEGWIALIDKEGTRGARALVCLLSAACLAAIIGYQRERAGKEAGLRTHMVVALGTALVVVAAAESGMDRDALSRVIQGLVTGIGFIGTGAILKQVQEGEIKGLTTAATLWATAAIGIACGLGLIAMAVVCTLLVWLIVAVLPRFSQ